MNVGNYVLYPYTNGIGVMIKLGCSSCEYQWWVYVMEFFGLRYCYSREFFSGTDKVFPNGAGGWCIRHPSWHKFWQNIHQMTPPFLLVPSWKGHIHLSYPPYLPTWRGWIMFFWWSYPTFTHQSDSFPDFRSNPALCCVNVGYVGDLTPCPTFTLSSCTASSVIDLSDIDCCVYIV